MRRTFLLLAGLSVLLIGIGLFWGLHHSKRADATTASDMASVAAPAVESGWSAQSVSAPASGAVKDAATAAVPASTPSAASVANAPTVAGPRGVTPRERLLGNAVPLAEQEGPGTAPGTVERRRLVRSDFKYPILLVRETLQRDPASGAEQVTAQTVMVGDHVLARARDGVTEEQMRALVERLGGQIRKKLTTPGLYLVAWPAPTVETVERGIAELQQAGAVIEYAEPDYVVHTQATFPNDANFGLLYGMHNTGQTIQGQAGIADADIDAPEAWDLGTGTTNIVVGVIDTGIDYNHPDLATNIWRNPGEIPGNSVDDDGNGYVDDIYGWNFINETANPYDDHYHGTHCAGTVGGVGNNSIGVAGVCWTVKMMALKFLDSGGSGTISDAIEAVTYATRMRARLTSNSWGGGGYSQAMHDAIETANRSNILFVAAAGNASNNNDSNPFYPASYTNANVIAVAATDNRDQLAGFSNYGLTTVDLGAPGVNTYSCQPGTGYQYLSGTSMATPHVAGAAALAWSLNPNATAAQIKQAILDGVDTIPALSNRCVTGGRLNVYKAILNLGLNVLSSSPAHGEVVFSLPVDFTITFTDPYVTGTVAAADLTVNGLPADSFTLLDPATVRFSFLSTPVSAQGTQVMFMAENSVTRIRDGDGLAEWRGVFRYDVVALAVTSTVPADATTVSLPLTNIVFEFNEPFDPASVQTSDLVLNQGTVTGVTILGPSTVSFTVSNIVSEGTLTLSIPAGAITDVYGNPCLAYNGTLEPDIGLIEFPVALKGRAPAGSLVYDAAKFGSITTPTDTDGFTLALDAGQTLTVVVLPATNTLQPAVEVRDPSNTLVGSASATGAGLPAVVQTVIISTPGTYTMSAAGVGGSTGGYWLQPVLNAAVDAEPNNTPATAQSLTGSFLGLTAGATRGAVRGEAGGGGGDDWYSFPVLVSNRVSVVSKGAAFELYDSGGALVAAGAPGRNVSFALDNYLAPVSGTYRLRVPAGSGEYVAVVTLDAAFDLENNNEAATAQALEGRTTVLGAIGGAGGLFAVEFRDPTPTRILTLDPETGAVLHSVLSPFTTSTNPFGLNLAHDGDALWYNAGAWFGDNTVYQLDPTSGAVLTNFTASLSAAPYGLAWVNGELFVADDGAINVYSDTTFAHLRTLPVPPSAYTFEGLAGDAANGWLYGISQSDLRLYRLDPLTGAVLTNAPLASIAYEQGLAAAGDELFVSETSGIGLTNIITVYDAATFAVKRRMPIAVTTMIAGLGGDGAGGGGRDQYTIAAQAGDLLTVTTLTPAGNPQQPHHVHNLLDPVLLLYAPNGSLISSNDNGAADGKNALISHSATTNGLYRVAVFGQNKSSGEYVLSVSGATGSAPVTFAVNGTVPTDGALLMSTPTQLTVSFNRNVLLSSVAAADVLVGGVPCSGWSVVDGRTLVFDLPGLAEGTHSVTIAGGAMLDVAGNPLAAYAGSFTTDLTAPTVVASSILNGDIVPAGTRVYTATFSEPLRAGQINSNVFTLVGAVSGARAAQAIGYAGTVLSLTFSNLPQDAWTLTLRSGDGLLEDLAGNNLAPGDYVVNFVTDVTTTNFPLPLVGQEPRGCLIFTGAASGYIGPTGDTDSFTINLDANQTLSVAARGAGSLSPTLAVSGPGGLLTNVAGHWVSDLIVSNAGTHTVTVAGAGGSTGAYTLSVVLNAALEPEFWAGLTNDAAATAQSLDASALVLTGTATRAAVWARGDLPLGPDGYGYRAFNVPFEFTDIRATGTRTMVGLDDAVVELKRADLGGFTNFNFYGTVRTNLFFSSNGLITFVSGVLDYLNTDLTSAPAVPTLAVFWDDLMVSGGPDVGVYWQVIGNRLIIQWHDLTFYGGSDLGTISFQAVLDQSDHSIQFNWLDLTSTHSGSEGASATVGLKDNGTQGARRLLVGYNNPTNSLVGTGKSLRIATNLPAGLGDDWYSFTLAASNRVTLVGNVAGPGTNIVVHLLTSNATVLATSGARSNVEAVIAGYVAPSNGTYYARVRVTSGADYTLAVLRNATFDLETNDTFAAAQSISAPQTTVLGYLAPPAGSVTNMDFYTFDLVAGNTVSARTQTPADGSGEFVNTLNPALDLYGPDGSIIASDNDGAPDGRNALLTHVTTSTGRHALRVRPQAGNGEYVLTATFPENFLPQVAITFPTNNMQFCALIQTVTVTATASDVDGSVVKVEFWADGAKFAEDVTAPYSAEYWAAAGPHTLQARAIDNDGLTNSSVAIPVTMIACLDPVVVSPVTNGLDYFFYIGNFAPSVTNLDLATPVISGTVTNFTLNVPGRATNDYFGIKYIGYVEVPVAAVYTFYTSSDDGSRLWIGSTNVVNNDGNHSNQERSGTIGLKAGWHPIRVNYYEATGSESLTVSFEGPTLSKRAIPTTNLWRILPTVTLTASDASAAELPVNTGLFTLSRSGNTNYAITVTNSIAGTASNGLDYVVIPASVTFSAGVSTATITILPISDSLAEGDETVVLSLIANPSVFVAGAPATDTVVIADAPMDAWRVLHFGSEANTPGIAGDLADPDGDGISNLIEYALGLDPNVANAAGLPAPAHAGGYLTLTYNQPKSATDITYRVEATGAVTGEWSAEGVTEISRVDQGSYWTVTARDAVPSAAAGSRFMRLRVTRP